MFPRKSALHRGREPSIKELALLIVVSVNDIPLSNRLASENGNDQDEWPLPCFKTAFSKTMISQDLLKGVHLLKQYTKRFHSVQAGLSTMKKYTKNSKVMFAFYFLFEG